MRATCAQQTHTLTDTHTHAHTTHAAFRRHDRFVLAGSPDTPKYDPTNDDAMIAKRTYLRVPLAPMPPRSATVWLVQLSHIKTGNSGASKLKGNVLNKKIQLFAAALNQGCRNAAELGGHVVPVLLGDQNLTMDEVTTNHLAQSLIKHAFLVAASEGLVDNQNRLHQDLVVVGDVGGLTLQSVPENVFGFDNTHQAVRARIDREPTGPEVAAPAAASAEAASAAASTLAAAYSQCFVPMQRPMPLPRRAAPCDVRP